MPKLAGVIAVYGGAMLAICAVSKMSTGSYLPSGTRNSVLFFLGSGAINVFAVGPVWMSSIWSAFLHLPDDIMWRMNQKRPFNFDVIVPDQILLGRQPRHLDDVLELTRAGVKAFIVMNEAWELCVQTSLLQGQKLKTLVLPTPDFSAPSDDDVIAGIRFVEDSLARNEPVYVHCNGGKGRSSVVVIGYLMKVRGLSKEAAYEFVKGKRKIANMKKFGGFMPQWRCLTRYEMHLAASPAASKKGH
jgi:atypical dual specificity phosphatase